MVLEHFKIKKLTKNKKRRSTYYCVMLCINLRLMYVNLSFPPKNYNFFMVVINMTCIYMSPCNFVCKTAHEHDQN